MEGEECLKVKNLDTQEKRSIYPKPLAGGLLMFFFPSVALVQAAWSGNDPQE